MFKIKRFLLVSCLLAGLVSISQAQAEDQVTKVNLSQAEIDRIVKTFTEQERIFRSALNNYSLKRDAVVQSLGFGGQISGEYHRNSLFTFDDKGQRYEKILFFPMPTLVDL